MSCTHQLGQVGVERMVRETAHPHAAVLGERDAQNIGGGNRIILIGLVEVAHAEEQ